MLSNKLFAQALFKLPLTFIVWIDDFQAVAGVRISFKIRF